MAEVIAPIFNFCLMLLVLYYFGKDYIKNFILNRSKLIEEAITNAEKEKKSSEVFLKTWEEKNIEKELSEMAKAMEESINLFRQKTLISANLHAERIKNEASILAESERRKVFNEVKKEIVRLAIENSLKYTKENFSINENKKLTSQVLKGIRHV